MKYSVFKQGDPDKVCMGEFSVQDNRLVISDVSGDVIHLLTSTIEAMLETDFGYEVKTKNSIYYLTRTKG